MPISIRASSAARMHNSSTRRWLRSCTSSMRAGWMRPSATSSVRVIRAVSRRTGSKQDSRTLSGVSSIITLTPVICSKARMLRPSRPMMRPFISSLGSGTAATTDSVVCSAASRWMLVDDDRRAFASAFAPGLGLDLAGQLGRGVEAGVLLDVGQELGARLLGGEAGNRGQRIGLLGLRLVQQGLAPVEPFGDRVEVGLAGVQLGRGSGSERSSRSARSSSRRSAAWRSSASVPGLGARSAPRPETLGVLARLPGCA